MQSDARERARQAYAARAWDEAYRKFSAAREDGNLDAEDLTAFADAAWWLGHTDESLTLSEEVYRLHVQGNRTPQAARLAIEMGFLAWRANGWFGLDQPAPAGCWRTHPTVPSTVTCSISTSWMPSSTATPNGRSS
jgi:hypothetical protein